MKHQVDSQPEKSIINFTLIHGTFARDADWVRNDTDDKSFRCKMRAELGDDFDLHFDCFDWGHEKWPDRLFDNTNKCRLFGAAELGKYLDACEDIRPGQSRYLVTHSHGGNVVLHAMLDPELSKKVSGVISLSSPFLKYYPVNFSRSVLGLSAAVLLIYAFDMASVPVWSYTIFYWLILLTLLFKGAFSDKVSDTEKIEARLQQLKLAGKQELSGKDGKPAFLAVRPHRDEVTILFEVTRWFGQFFRSLWNLTNRFGSAVILIYFASAFLLGSLDKLPLDIDVDKFQYYRTQVDHYLLTPLMLAATGILSVVVAMRWSYAFDSVPWVPSLDVKSEIVPWEGAHKETVPTWGLVKHTNIQNQSPSIVATWIRETI